MSEIPIIEKFKHSKATKLHQKMFQGHSECLLARKNVWNITNQEPERVTHKMYKWR